LDLNYSYGKLHGEQKEYYPNGRLKSFENYNNNKLVGTQEAYYRNGKLKSQIFHNESKRSQYYDINGNDVVHYVKKHTDTLSFNGLNKNSKKYLQTEDRDWYSICYELHKPIWKGIVEFD